MTLREDVQRSLDDRLLRLLKMIRANATFPAVAGVVDTILADFTHPEQMPLTPGDKLLSPKWKPHWERNEEVTWGLFGNIETDKLVRALHGLFTELARLVCSSDTPHLKSKNMKRVEESLCEFLSRRGYDVADKSRVELSVQSHRNAISQTLKNVIYLALCARDTIYQTSRRDECDADYKKRVNDWEREGGAYPAGSLTELISSLLPSRGYGDFDKAVQTANAQALPLSAAGFLLPKIEAVSVAHRALLNQAVAISNGDSSCHSQAFVDAELALNDAVNELIPLANTAEPVADTPPKATAVDLPKDEADDKLPAAKRKHSPSREKAKAVYDWAMSAIPNAENMTVAELFDAIECHPSSASEALPGNAETFGKYLRDAGVKRYGKKSDRKGKSIHRADEL